MTLEPAVVVAVVTAVSGAISYVFKQLWDTHKESDVDVRGQRDLALVMGRESTAAIRALADELEHERSDHAPRRRKGVRR
jgi:hypothetical protein